MIEVNAAPIRTHHVTLPPCVSSFTDHAGCQGFVRTVSSVIKCDCVACHGEEATPAALCAGCRSSMPVVIDDNAVNVGDEIRVSRSMGRYCEACRAEFMADLKGVRP
jgi:hypothetical protein